MKNMFLTLSIAGLFFFSLMQIMQGEAKAQISTNLDALPSNEKNEQTIIPPSSPHHKTQRHPSLASHNLPPKPKATKTIIPAVPLKAPIIPIIPPPFPKIEKHPPVQPENVIAVEKAQNQVVALEDQNLRIIFSQNSTDFNLATINSVHNFGIALAHNPEKRLILKSYTTIAHDDISMPKRIALARALSIRSILMQAGIASTRIYPIAYGAPQTATKNPSDYVDILIEENPQITNIPFQTQPIMNQ